MKIIDYAQLDPGIRRTVTWLRSHGFHTTDSGDGVSKPDMDCAWDVPNVMMQVDACSLVSNANEIARLLEREHGVVCGAGEDPRAPRIEASYNPVDGVAILVLTGVDDSMLVGVP